jgi:hypothetical protein
MDLALWGALGGAGALNYYLDAAMWAAIASGAGALTYFVLNAWRSDARRTRRVLRRARVVPIAELEDGKLACIVGVVEAEGEPLEAPISRQPCVAYDTTMQYFSDPNLTIVSRVEVMRRMAPFFVSDGTGRVRIDAAEAALCNRPIGRNERFEERVIRNGDKVRLVGSATLEPTLGASGERGFRDGALKATITGTTKYPLLIDVERR